MGTPLWHLALDVPGPAADAFTRLLARLCDSVSWSAPEAGGAARIEGFSADRPDAAMLATLIAVTAASQGVEAPPLSLARLEPRDWLDDNRRRFPPLRAGRYFIHGSHHRGPVPPGSIGIRLDSGAAFGSGEHASTAGCLAALDGLVRRPRAALDVGCGSGILAVAMARTWRLPVLAVDVDPIAVGVTRVNARGNGVAGLVRTAVADGYRLPLLRRLSPFDLVVANILARPLMRMAGDLARHLDAGGVAVLSGFLAKDADRVLAAHRARGMGLVRRITIDDWQTLILRR